PPTPLPYTTLFRSSDLNPLPRLRLETHSVLYLLLTEADGPTSFLRLLFQFRCGSKTDPLLVLPSIPRCAAIPSRSPSKNPSTARINLMQFPLRVLFQVALYRIFKQQTSERTQTV